MALATKPPSGVLKGGGLRAEGGSLGSNDETPERGVYREFRRSGVSMREGRWSMFPLLVQLR